MNALLSRRRYELLALVIALACCGVHAWSDRQSASFKEGEATLSGIQLLEGRASDLKFRIRGERPPHPDVVVVEIDEKSVQKFGLYPWPRTRVATAFRNLHAARPRAIGLDISYIDEGNDTTGLAYRAILEQFDCVAEGAGPDASTRFAAFRSTLDQASTSSGDDALAEVFRSAPELVQGVFGYGASERNDFTLQKQSEYVELLSPHVIDRVPGTIPGSFFELRDVAGYPMYSAQAPLPVFAKAGNRFAHLNAVPDSDGGLRRTPLLAKLAHPSGFLPVLGLQTAAVYLGAKVEPVVSSLRKDRLEAIRLTAEGKPAVLIPVPTDEPFTLIDYPGPKTVYPRVSIADVIDGAFERSQIEGKLVLVGLTLVGNSGDQRVTPFSSLEPGIFSHAAMASNILKGEFLQRPGTAWLIECGVMVLLGLLLARLIPKMKSFLVKGLILLSVVFAYVAVDQLLFARGVQVATVMPVASLVMTSFGVIFLGYLSVDREKLALRSTFSRYLGEDVMEEAILNPDKLNRGEKREMTVLFSDIRGFTTLSERMAPEKLAAFINDYLTPMTQIVFDEKGTLDKYIGDAVMAFWNAPLDQPDHALRACRAAVGFLRKLEELRPRWRAQGLPELDIGVGINSGPMIVGNMGSDVRVDYTVLGDAVNLASRLEGTNKEYETRIIISEATYQAVKSHVVARRLGAVRVKGKLEPVGIFELRDIGKASSLDAEAIAAFEGALEAYTAQRFGEAAAGFQQTLKRWHDDAPARRYLEELTVLQANPPGDGWDGVYTATTK